MKLIAPDYYSRFRCIGGACPHNCCIGWEIDIDEDSLRRYHAMSGALGKKLRSHIAEDACPHFLLGESGRCPFLNTDNLCELIIQQGENSLCQICRDHPRFYNEWSHRTEVGIGLCCPAAAELILSGEAPVTLLAISEDDRSPQMDDLELQLLALREHLIGVLQNRCLSVEARFASALHAVGLSSDGRTAARWAEVYGSLERMDNAWDLQLARLHRGDTVSHDVSDRSFSIAQEHLAVYFLYRHLFGALEDGLIAERVALAVHATQLLSSLAHDTTELIDISRLYSAEIEYSDENLAAILDALSP